MLSREKESNMAKVKLIFIVNDNDNKALDTIAKCKIKKGGKQNIVFDTTHHYSDVVFNNLLSYRHYYRFDKYLFFEGCEFGSIAGYDKNGLINDLSGAIQTVSDSNGWNISWAFIRIINSDDNTKAAIDLLSTQYMAKQGDEDGDDGSSATFMNFGRTYVLNKCFIDSRYTMFGNNISHETINCFKTDNGERYLYLCSSGVLKKDYFLNSDETLPKKYIDESKIVYLDYSKTGKDTDDNAQYVFLRKVDRVQKLDCAFDNSVVREHYVDINYGGKNIVDIFGANSYQTIDRDSLDEQQLEQDNAVKVYATFKVVDNSAYVPANKQEALVIGRSKNEDGSENEGDGLDKLKGSTMRHYVIEGSTFFDKIEAKINSITWEEEHAPSFDEYERSQEYETDKIPDSILGIVGESNKETYYSDLIAYAFSKSHVVLNKFLEKAGINKRVDYAFYDVQRENANMDIRIKNVRGENKFLVIIENKILANFSVNELQTWEHFVKENVKHAATINQLNQERERYQREHPEKKLSCQLPKYYLLGRYLATINGIPDDIDCLIICPEQYVDSYNASKNEYCYGEMYSVKSYNLIYEATKEVLDENSDQYLEDNDKSILKEILKCLSVHIQKANILLVYKNRHRFAKSVGLLRRIEA